MEGGSDLIGRTLEDAAVFDETGPAVVGVWAGGKFIASPDPSTTIEENTVLLVAGRDEAFESVGARPIPTHDDHSSRVVVCGYGATGRAVTEIRREKGVEVEVIDVKDHDGVDGVGNVTDPETLAAADIGDARTVVLTLDEDDPTIYATLIAKQAAPDVEVVARADSENVWKLYNAGADFVLSLPTVTGEILASILADETESWPPRRSSFGRKRPRSPAGAWPRSICGRRRAVRSSPSNATANSLPTSTPSSSSGMATSSSSRAARKRPNGSLSSSAENSGCSIRLAGTTGAFVRRFVALRAPSGNASPQVSPWRRRDEVPCRYRSHRVSRRIRAVLDW